MGIAGIAGIARIAGPAGYRTYRTYRAYRRVVEQSMGVGMGGVWAAGVWARMGGVWARMGGVWAAAAYGRRNEPKLFNPAASDGATKMR